MTTSILNTKLRLAIFLKLFLIVDLKPKMATLQRVKLGTLDILVKFFNNHPMTYTISMT